MSALLIIIISTFTSYSVAVLAPNIWGGGTAPWQAR